MYSGGEDARWPRGILTGKLVAEPPCHARLWRAGATGEGGKGERRGGGRQKEGQVGG